MLAAALETALEMPHSKRTIQVTRERRARTKSLSVRPLQVLIELPETLVVGRVPWGTFYLPDPNRAVLDGARWPRLVGGREDRRARRAFRGRSRSGLIAWCSASLLPSLYLVFPSVR